MIESIHPTNDGSTFRGAGSPIRIAYVLHGLQVGGTERSVVRLTQHLCRQRFSPMVICLSRIGDAAKWLPADVQVIALNKRPGNDWRIKRRLADVLAAEKVEIVQSHAWGTLIETVCARRSASVPVHIHAERGTVLGAVRPKGPRDWLRAKAMRWALTKVDVVISNAVSVAQRVETRTGFPVSRIRIIPNGIESLMLPDARSIRTELRQKLNIGDNAFVFGSIGRLTPVKGFHLAVDALAQLNRQDKEIHLILVGDGPERSSLEQQSRQHGVADRVHFVGMQHQIGHWLAAMDLYVNTSLSEGMSQSLVEAMSAGLPIVATDVGDNASIVGNDNNACGFIVPANSLEAVARAIEHLRGDSECCTRLGRNSHQLFQNNHGIDRMMGSYQSLYSTLHSSIATAGFTSAHACL